ncbi:ABC transporter permease [Labrys okinawensis]|uniref:ABC transporter permease n=1 Tax=Labrys okinawensis TaxID=346911 RepID=UPI0039BD06CA
MSTLQGTEAIRRALAVLQQSQVPTFMTAFERQRRVMVAVLLRNVRTRFFGHGLGYVFAILWPVAHMLLLAAMFIGAGRAPPVGESTLQFVCTGCVPFMAYSYLARFMMVSLISAKPLMGLPEVKVMDVLLSSALLEILSAAVVIIVMICLGVAFDVSVWPQSITTAFCAMSAAILLGVGFGVLNGVIVLAYPMWMTGYALLSIAIWGASGVMFIPDLVPEPYRTWLSYNPMLQVVEWMRAAYYEGYGDQTLNRSYVVAFGAATLLAGLILERVMRGYVLSSR